MDPKTLELLDFRRVQEMLAKEADTVLGRERAFAAVPVSAKEARAEQRLGRELMEVLSKGASPGLQGASDVRGRVEMAAQGIVLQGTDLYKISITLSVMEALSRWLDHIPAGLSGLLGVKARLPFLPELRSNLTETVDVDGTIKDSASPELRTIRRSLSDFQDRIRRRAEELVRRKDISQYLQESIVSLRDGRYVLPVKQEHASKVSGLVHDQSGSGQTLFIEPAELVEMGNQLRRLQLKERDEIDRILVEVSRQVGNSAGPITSGCEALADFDFGLAKARLAFRWKGSFPTLSEEHVLRLVEAWHPMLTGTPVPLDIHLSEDDTRTVVITGPNMGGKTVALKTCGLLTAMALSGFPCPCREKSVVGEISDVLSDIGDEQSIEENLSTFSAHISNVVRILKNAGPGKLILIDELGAGTDPQEGAALALAIVRRLNDSGALSIITSHFSELKVAAQETPGMRNASVEWDAVNMLPTYRLVIGRPGRSNAFLVAKRLGLPQDVLDEAKMNMQQELLNLDEVIEDMEKSAQRVREDAEAAAADRRRAAELRREWEEKTKDLEAKRKEALSQAKREAAALVSRARVELEKAVKEFRDWDKRGRAEYSEAVRDMRDRLRAARDELGHEEEEVLEGLPVMPEDAVPGTPVAVAGFREPGVIVEPPDADRTAVVRIGAFSMRIRIEDLRHVKGQAGGDKRGDDKAARESRSGMTVLKAQEVSYEIDLRGMTGEEAIDALDKYFDDALLAGLSQVRIIHGKGTGALRKAVTAYLKSHPRISESRLGETGEGGSGVTVAKFKP